MSDRLCVRCGNKATRKVKLLGDRDWKDVCNRHPNCKRTRLVCPVYRDEEEQ